MYKYIIYNSVVTLIYVKCLYLIYIIQVLNMGIKRKKLCKGNYYTPGTWIWSSLRVTLSIFRQV